MVTFAFNLKRSAPLTGDTDEQLKFIEQQNEKLSQKIALRGTFEYFISK